MARTTKPPIAPVPKLCFFKHNLLNSNMFRSILTILRDLLNIINPLNAELNPIGYLLALLEAHHILHVSGIRVKQHIHTVMAY